MCDWPACALKSRGLGSGGGRARTRELYRARPLQPSNGGTRAILDQGRGVSRADAAARNVIDEHQIADLPIDVDGLARRLGILVIRQPGADELSGMLLRRDSQDAIGINPALNPEQQRFALAHLIGHHQLHRRRELILDTDARYSYGNLASLPTDREESEATRFAAALLAPEGAVRRAAAEADFRTAAQLVDLLAPRFELTVTAMTYRLMSLGIILDV